jgi:Domain of unknown function (DUF4350)
MTSTSVPVTPTLKGAWRSARGVLLVGALVLLSAALPVLLTVPAPVTYLDPGDTSLEGGAALAELLRDRGVQVTPTDSVTEATNAAGPRVRVLVSRPDTLTGADARELEASGADLVVVGTAHAAVFLPGARTRPAAEPRSVHPGCALRAAVLAGSAHLGSATISSASADVGCYRVGGRPTLVQGDGVVLATTGAFMTNRRLDEDGNAALAMNLAGADADLRWLVAPAEHAPAAPAGEESLVDLVPPQVPWAVATLGLTVLLAALWRGRRLGPVVVEPVPVVVRAAETVEGRGRLYRAHRAREQAAGNLRSAAVSRIVTWVGFTSETTPHRIVDAVSARVGQDAGEVERLLYGPVPEDDRALVRLVEDIDALERRVRDR